MEDDSAIRDLMIYALNSAGFISRGFVDGEGLFDALKDETPQLIMLDIMLPGEDGDEILRRLRGNAATADIPVIMATAKGTEYDKVIGLDLGADDYLAKPFGMMEMVSRVKAVLRRTEPNDSAKILQVGSLTLNLGEHTVTAKGERVQLTLKEYEILKKFMENLGLVLPTISFCKTFGGLAISEKPVRWTSISVHCGRNLALVEIILKPLGALDIGWRPYYDKTYFSFHFSRYNQCFSCVHCTVHGSTLRIFF